MELMRTARMSGWRLRDRERLKWLLWHGHAGHAIDAAQSFADEAWGMADEADDEANAKLERLNRASDEFATYIRRNASQLVDYGERYRAGERISTGFVESAVNQIIAKRFSKGQSMRWTHKGAHLLLQTRTRVLDDDLEDLFRRRWPRFRLPASASAPTLCEPAPPPSARSRSFALPTGQREIAPAL